MLNGRWASGPRRRLPIVPGDCVFDSAELRTGQAVGEAVVIGEGPYVVQSDCGHGGAGALVDCHRRREHSVQTEVLDPMPQQCAGPCLPGQAPHDFRVGVHLNF